MGTLWDIITKKKVEAPKPKLSEENVYNPLSLKINGSVKIKTIDLEDVSFTVAGIREIKREENGETFPIVDYDLVSNSIDSKPIRKRIRLLPMKDANSQFSDDVILFDFVSEFPYDAGYQESLSSGECAEPHIDSNGNAEVDEKGEPVFDFFWRVNDIKDEWDAETKYLEDKDRNGIVEANEIRRGTLKYWDFWRNTKDADNNDMLEFYIVEMDQNGYFEIWRGASVDPSRIAV